MTLRNAYLNPALHALGQCLCGQVEFRTTLPSLWVAHCHCSRCQRAHGAAFVTWVGMPEARVEIVDTHQSLRWYRVTEGGDRGVCGRCGSSMFFRSDQWPGELHIARALFVDKIDREPQMHAYYDTHADWARVDDRLPNKPDPTL